MANEEEPRRAFSLFGDMTEADRLAALDAFGKMLIRTRDHAIRQWDRHLDGGSGYPPWDRLLQRHPDIDKFTRAMMKEALPHMIDTLMYCLLADLDAVGETIRVSVDLGHFRVDNLARASWGLCCEPVGENGWLARFSTERFEQPT